MNTYVALIRGINVGGNRRMRMADLAAWCSEVGCEEVKTYIQSGNVVASYGGDAGELERRLEREIEKQSGFDVSVVVRSDAEWRSAIEYNAFPLVDTELRHIGFLKNPPSKAAVEKLEGTDYAPDESVVHGREIYLHLPNGMGRSKLGKSLDQLGTPVTVRNWRTVLKLAELATPER